MTRVAQNFNTSKYGNTPVKAINISCLTSISYYVWDLISKINNMLNLLSNCCVAWARSDAKTLSARGGGCGGRSSSLLLYLSPPHSRERWRRTPLVADGTLGNPPDRPLKEPALTRRPGRSILEVLMTFFHHSPHLQTKNLN